MNSQPGFNILQDIYNFVKEKNGAIGCTILEDNYIKESFNSAGITKLQEVKTFIDLSKSGQINIPKLNKLL